MSQLQRLRAKLADSPIDALFVSDITNVQWLTGFSGSTGYAIVTADDAVFLSDSRYTIQAAEEIEEFDVQTLSGPMSYPQFFAHWFDKLGLKSVGFESSTTVATLDAWKKEVTATEWVQAPDLIKPLRMVKTQEEIEKIKRACAITDACLEHLERMIQPGVVEFDIQLDLEFFLRRQGAGIAFHPIVVSGANSARPHGFATDKKLEVGDFLTIDLGAKLDGYCSDITRTFVVGDASDRHVEIYNQVLKAEVEAIKALKPGVPAKDVDALAREILEEKDLNKYFGHGLGHGLGRDVHDFGGLGAKSKDTIEVGQVWTVEPGVYIEGFGGVRIEDDVVVTDGEPLILTHYPKDLKVLG